MSLKYYVVVCCCLQGSVSVSGQETYTRATKALYMQSHLGYFINLKKSQLQPVSKMVQLGLGVCSHSLSFWIPDKKKHSFAQVREGTLASDSVLLKEMQRFVGKCQSFILVFPAASLFVRECCSFMVELEDVTPVRLNAAGV